VRNAWQDIEHIVGVADSQPDNMLDTNFYLTKMPLVFGKDQGHDGLLFRV
jgi:hypothetical protein